MSNNQELLFGIRVERIRRDADEIWRALAGTHELAPSTMQKYDIRASAKNLRDVADKLDGINERIDQRAELQAAE